MTADSTLDSAPKRPICKLCKHHRPPRLNDPLAGLSVLVSLKVQREITERAEQRRREEEITASVGRPSVGHAFIGKPPEFYDWCAAHSAVEADNPDPVTGEAPAYYFACTSMNTRDAPCQLFENAGRAAPARHLS